MKKFLIKFKDGSFGILNIDKNEVDRVKTSYTLKGKIIIQDPEKIPLYHIDFSDVISFSEYNGEED